MDLNRAQRLRQVPFDLLTPEMQARVVSGCCGLFRGWASEHRTAQGDLHTHLLVWFAELTRAEPGWPHGVPVWPVIPTTPLGTISKLYGGVPLGTISKLYGGVGSTSGALPLDPSEPAPTVACSVLHLPEPSPHPHLNVSPRSRWSSSRSSGAMRGWCRQRSLVALASGPLPGIIFLP